MGVSPSNGLGVTWTKTSSGWRCRCPTRTSKSLIDSYDNALAESFNGLYKTELIRHQGPWRGLDDVEHATLDYVDWFNDRRLHGELGMVPPSEFEAAYYDSLAPAKVAV